MKKALFVLSLLLVLLLCFCPLARILCSFVPLHFELTRPLVLSAAIALTALAVLALASKCETAGPAAAVLFALTMPLSLIGGLCVMLTEHSGLPDLALLTLAAPICLFLGFRFGRPKVLKILALTLAILIIIPLAPLWPAFIIGNVGESTVVRTVESPGGVFRAELVDDDQGALGGNTLVYVCRGRGLDAGFFRFVRRQVVYTGAWDEFMDMTLDWEGDSRLIINGRAYDNPLDD